MARYRFGALCVALLLASSGLTSTALGVRVWAWLLVLACAVTMLVFWRTVVTHKE